MVVLVSVLVLSRVSSRCSLFPLWSLSRWRMVLTRGAAERQVLPALMLLLLPLLSSGSGESSASFFHLSLQNIKWFHWRQNNWIRTHNNHFEHPFFFIYYSLYINKSVISIIAGMCECLSWTPSKAIYSTSSNLSSISLCLELMIMKQKRLSEPLSLCFFVRFQSVQPPNCLRWQ